MTVLEAKTMANRGKIASKVADTGRAKDTVSADLLSPESSVWADVATRTAKPHLINGLWPTQPRPLSDILACLLGGTVAEPRQTSVYRYFDKFGILIYVGVTSRRTSRNTEHNNDKDWWEFVRRQDVEHHQTRDEALARERSLIERFQPPFNRVHNENYPAIKEFYLRARASASNGDGSGISKFSRSPNEVPKFDLSIDKRQFWTKPEDASDLNGIKFNNPIAIYSAGSSFCIGTVTGMDGTIIKRFQYTLRRHDAVFTIATLRVGDDKKRGGLYFKCVVTDCALTQ